MKQSLSVPPFFRLSRRFFGIVPLVFSKFLHGARNLYQVVRERAGFSGKILFAPKFRNWTKNGPKAGFFEFIEKFGH